MKKENIFFCGEERRRIKGRKILLIKNIFRSNISLWRRRKTQKEEGTKFFSGGEGKKIGEGKG